MYIVCLEYFIDQGDPFHGLVRLQLELGVVVIDQLVAQSVYIAAETSLTWQHVLVIVDVLVKE